MRKHAFAAIFAIAFGNVATVTAQVYPSRPITMIVLTGPGSTSDVIGRLLAEGMRSSLGRPVIVENVSGADGSIGAGRAARASPDGYTINLGFLGSHVLNGALYALPYDVLNDFAPISPVIATPFFLLASNKVPARDAREFIAWLRTNSDRASVGAASAGPRLVSALLQKETGTHFGIVPYRGVPPSMQDLVAGEIDFVFVPPDSLPLARAGKVKALAVTSEQRSTLAPDIPTFAEIGLPHVVWSAWYALFAPKGTPSDIIEKLNSATREALGDPAVRTRILDLGFEIFPRERQTPEALAALQKAESEKWWPIIKETGMKAE